MPKLNGEAQDKRNYTNDNETPAPVEEREILENPYDTGRNFTNDEVTPGPDLDDDNPYAEIELFSNDLGTPRPAGEKTTPTGEIPTGEHAEKKAEESGFQVLGENERVEESGFNLFEDAAAPAAVGAEKASEVKYDKPADNSFSLFRSEVKKEAEEEAPRIAGVTPLGEAQSPVFHRNRKEVAAAPAEKVEELVAEGPKVEEAPKIEAALKVEAAPKVEEVPKVAEAKTEVAEAPKAAEAPAAEAPKASAPKRDIANEIALRNELVNSLEAGKNKSVWRGLFSRKSRYDAIETAMQDYLAVTDPKKREAAANKLYESCRNYLDNHLETYEAGNKQIQKIRDLDKNRVRKQAVVHMLKIMESGQLPEFSRSSSQFMNAKPGAKNAKQGTKRVKLNFQEIEASLRVGNKGGAAYQDLKASIQAQKKSNVQKRAAKKGHGMV